MDYDKEFQYKEDLIEHAKERGVSTEGTRAEITERLQAQDEINAAAQEDEEAAQAVSESDEPTPDEDSKQEAAKEEAQPAPGTMTTKDLKVGRTATKDEGDGTQAEETDDGKVLVKMTKRAAMHQVAGARFTQQHPFALLDKEDAERVAERNGFRRATAAEAEAYYNG